MNPSYAEAIIALSPDAKFQVLSNDINQIDWQSDDIEQPSKEAIQAKLTELQADYDALQYQRDRASQYPSIQDQLDMQYWDSVNGTTTWKDVVAKVKAENPKPE